CVLKFRIRGVDIACASAPAMRVSHQIKGHVVGRGQALGIVEHRLDVVRGGVEDVFILGICKACPQETVYVKRPVVEANAEVLGVAAEAEADIANSSRDL